MLSIATCLQTVVHFPGLQARDHLKCVCDGAFERLFGSRKGEIWGLPWVLLKLRFDLYIMTTFFVASDAFSLVLTSQQHSLLSSTMATYRCPEVLSLWRGVTVRIATHNSSSLFSNVPWQTQFAPKMSHKLLSSNAPGRSLENNNV